MVYFYEKCTKLHENDELCPHIREQMKKSPELLGEAANFINIAGQYHLVTSQSLDVVAQRVNHIVGSNLGIEGTHQFARDIQVFNRLNTEFFPKVGAFSSPDAAKIYLENATEGQLTNIKAKIVGAGQEVDWLRSKQVELRSFFEKSSLLTRNAPGVDGEIVNRFTGKELTRVTVKGASTQGGIKTGADGIIKALKKGTLNPDETVFAPKGMKERLLNDLERNIQHAKSTGDKATVDILTKAKENLEIVEHGSVEDTVKNQTRLLEKIKNGKANTNITVNDALKKAKQGAVIGAVIGLTISSVTNYIRYRNGNLTRDEAFVNIGEDTSKSALMGAAMGTITIFLPAGATGLVAGFAVGIYLNAALTNVLDEIFGKGVYREILVACGCVMGASMNLSEAMKTFAEDRNAVQASLKRTKKAHEQIDAELKKISKNWG